MHSTILSEDRIGGAYIRRGFRMGDRQLTTMDPPLTREEVLSIPSRNRSTLIDQGNLEVFPPAPADGSAPQIAADADADTKLFVVHMGMGRFDVIVGKKLNEKPLKRAEAEQLAATKAEVQN